MDLHPNKWDFSYLELFRKGVECETNHDQKFQYSHILHFGEAIRDVCTESIKEISPLIQFDPESNQELKEVKVQLYKISISFTSESKAEFEFGVTIIVII